MGGTDAGRTKDTTLQGIVPCGPGAIPLARWGEGGAKVLCVCCSLSQRALNGGLTSEWYSSFLSLWERTGY